MLVNRMMPIRYDEVLAQAYVNIEKTDMYDSNITKQENKLL